MAIRVKKQCKDIIYSCISQSRQDFISRFGRFSLPTKLARVGAEPPCPPARNSGVFFTPPLPYMSETCQMCKKKPHLARFWHKNHASGTLLSFRFDMTHSNSPCRGRTGLPSIHGIRAVWAVPPCPPANDVKMDVPIWKLARLCGII